MKKIIFFIAAAVILLGAGFFVLHSPAPQPETGNSISAAKTVKLGKIPASAEIVYRGNDRDYIYVMDKNGGHVTQITFENPRTWEHAAVSFDHRYVVANAHEPQAKIKKESTVFIFDLVKGTEAQLLPNFYEAGGGGVDWSPDGFAYFSATPQEGVARNVYKIKPDGYGLTQLTHLVRKFSPPAPELAVTGDVSVSPDGKQVAYIRQVFRQRDSGKVVGDTKDDWIPHAEVWTMDADGSNQRRVNDGGNELGMYGYDWIGAYDPEHSPDGTQMVFSRTNTAYRNQIPTAHDLYISNLDGTGLRRVTQPGPISMVPDWKGNLIVYTEISQKDNYAGAAVINVDGTGYKHIKAGAFMSKFIPK